MHEHLIRFRGGWQIEAAGGAPAPARLLTLPLSLPYELIPPVRLSRNFGRPAIDPAREQLMLRLERIGGTESIRLNGHELARLPAGGEDLAIPLDGLLLERNRLELVVATFSPPGGETSGATWGQISLVVSPRTGNEL